MEASHFVTQEGANRWDLRYPLTLLSWIPPRPLPTPYESCLILTVAPYRDPGAEGGTQGSPPPPPATLEQESSSSGQGLLGGPSRGSNLAMKALQFRQSKEQSRRTNQHLENRQKPFIYSIC